LAFLIANVVGPDSDYLRTRRGVVRVDYFDAFLIGVWVHRVVDFVYDIPLELEIVSEDGVRWGAVHLEAKEPLGDVALIPGLQLFDFFIELDQLLIFLDDCFGRVRIVVDAPVTDDVGKVSVLDLVSNPTGFLKRVFVFLLQENLERWRLDCLGYIDDLLQTGDTEGHIH